MNKESRKTKDLQITKFINDCVEKSEKSQHKAKVMKIAYIVLSTMVIIGGTILTADGYFRNETPNYLQMLLGSFITITKTFMTTFSLEKKGFLYKTISIKFRKLSRKLTNLKDLKASTMDYKSTLNRAYQEFDDLDITMYSTEQSFVSEKNSPV